MLVSSTSCMWVLNNYVISLGIYLVLRVVSGGNVSLTGPCRPRPRRRGSALNATIWKGPGLFRSSVAAGIIGTGMLALPALVGSAAYALGEILSWHVGLARLPLRAKAFYATITVGMALGVALNFSAIDPIRALYWSAVLNGVVAVPVMVMMMRLTMRPSVMAEFTLPLRLQVMGWLATATMAVTVVAMVASWLK